MNVVHIHLLHGQELLAPSRKALDTLRSHGAWDETARGFGVDLEAFAAAGLAEDLFACAVDVRGVDLADAGSLQSIVDFE